MPKAHSSSACKLGDLLECCGGKAPKSAQSAGRPLPAPGERPHSRAAPALVYTGSRAPCKRLGKPSILAAAAPRDSAHRTNSTTERTK